MQPGGHPLLLLLACPLILADGLPFDTELYPPSLDLAHNLLSKEQLLHMFGVQEAHMVDHTRWGQDLLQGLRVTPLHGEAKITEHLIHVRLMGYS